jgi:hypothetical protein
LLWADRAGEAKLGDLLGETPCMGLGRTPMEVVRAEVFVDGAFGRAAPTRIHREDTFRRRSKRLALRGSAKPDR